MRKLFFSIAFVLMGALTFANNSDNIINKVTEVFGTCTYTITTTVTYPNGSSYSYDTTYTTEANSLSDCIQKAKNHVAFLNMQ